MSFFKNKTIAWTVPDNSIYFQFAIKRYWPQNIYIHVHVCLFKWYLNTKLGWLDFYSQNLWHTLTLTKRIGTKKSFNVTANFSKWLPHNRFILVLQLVEASKMYNMRWSMIKQYLQQYMWGSLLTICCLRNFVESF